MARFMHRFFLVSAFFCFVPLHCVFAQCAGNDCSWKSDENGDYLLMYNSNAQPVRVYVNNKDGIRLVPENIPIRQYRVPGPVVTHNPSSPVPAQSSSRNTFLAYYPRLSEPDKKVYLSIYEAVKEHRDELVLDGNLESRLFDIAFCVLFDHPELFWVKQDIKAVYRSDGYSEWTEISFKYHQFDEGLEKSRILFENAVQHILLQAQVYKTDFEKERFVHDYLVQNVSYEADCDYEDSSYSALVKKKSVCDGFSKAFQYLMLRLGIQSWYVPGKVHGGSNSGEHAWNQVQIGGECYNVDVTSDSSHPDIEKGSKLRLPNYFYFNVSDKMLSSEHYVRDTDVEKGTTSLPACNGTFSFEKAFSDGLGKAYRDVYGVSEKSVVRSLDEFFALMREQCQTASQAKFRAYAVVFNEKLVKKIQQLSIETQEKEFARHAVDGALAGHRIKSIETTTEKLGENIYLVYLTMEYVRAHR